MNYRHFKYEGWLYWLAFLLALSLRLIHLGSMSLNDAQASAALQALAHAQGLRPALDPQPAYILFTIPLFFIYGGGTNFLARLIPAVVGSALVFAPRLFDDRLKPRPSTLLAFFIALDPGLTAISRQAASPILAITFFAFALGFLNQNKVRMAGVFAALALLGGPTIWPGIIGLALAAAIYQPIAARLAEGNGVPAPQLPKLDAREALIAIASTLLLAGTLFFTVPNGLSAAAESLSTYLGGWIVPSKIHLTWMLFSLPIYQPLAILLAVMALVRGIRGGSLRVIPLALWMLVSLLLALAYPSKQVTDLAWMLLPLLALASLELARFIDVRPEERAEALGAAVLAIFLLIFCWLNYTALVWLSPGQNGYSLRLALVVGSLILLSISLVLVGFGWSKRIAQVGAVGGLLVTLGLFGLADSIGTAGLRGMLKPELWWQPGIPLQEHLLASTVDDLSQWGRGYNDAIPVLIYGVDSPALQWALRAHQPQVVKSLDLEAAPELVITNYAGDPGLSAAYRGQDFVWRETTSWELAQPGDWPRWTVYREMTQTGENIILWARSDLFLHSNP